MNPNALTCVAVLAIPSFALADDFVTLDRMDRTSTAGVETAYLVTPSNGGDRPTVLRFDGHGQYVDPGTGLGGYLDVPASYVSDGGVTTGGLGDIELGGIYAPRLAGSMVTVVFHAGLALPTGSSSENSANANLLAAQTRIDDFYLALPSATSLRLGVSPIVRSGRFFARLDVALDTNLSAANNGAFDNFIRLNAGVGVDAGAVSVMAEVTNLHVSEPGSESQWIDTGAVSVRGRAGDARPYLAIGFPLEHVSHEGMDAAITLGLDWRLR